MKAITMILLTLFMTKSCNQSTKKDLEQTQIQYVANTRGFYQKITIQNRELFISKIRNEEGKGNATPISDTDWKELVTLFSKLDLEKINTYEAPSQKRFHDGSAMADVTILYKDVEYKTKTFDHGTPPVEMAAFINKVVSLENNQ